jgi:nicotinamide-nucleotide amidase
MTTLPAALTRRAETTLTACRAAGLMVATAESCTGGLVAAALTAIAGSSDVVERGFVTYSNPAKTELLGVAPALLATHGAVSEAVARAMAEGALARSNAGIAVAVTGIAGPGGGSLDKPVGLVHFACARSGAATVARREVFAGDRDAVRLQAALTALAMLDSVAAPPDSPPSPGSPP